MTKEQEVIEKLTNGREEMDLITLIRKFKKEGIENFVVTKKEYIETVLSMLKENSAEIQQKNTELAEKNAEIEKKDKIIDLMARAIDNYDSQLVINTFKDKEHVKQYFERESKECQDIENGITLEKG